MAITHDLFIDRVDGLYSDYSPADSVREQIAQVDLTPVSAPSGMGKDTVIKATGLHKVVSETIRQPRVDNGALEVDGVDYFFVGDSLERVLDDVANRMYVQIGMGPARKSFYGSRASSYPQSGAAIIDVMTNQLADLQSLPFKTVAPAFIVAQSFEAWMARLKGRGVMTKADWADRHSEAKRSLSDGLEDDSYVFIVNENIEVAAGALKRFAEEREIDDDENIRGRTIAKQILKSLCED